MKGSKLISFAFTLLLECAVITAMEPNELSVSISVFYTPPPRFIPGPNEYRAASGPVTVTCNVTGGTGDVSYQWSSTCRNCPFNTKTTKMVERAAVNSRDNGTHTCKVVKGEMEGSASITFIVKGAGIHVFNGVPKGSFPNNSLVSVDATDTMFRLRLFCRSDSMMRDVGELIGLDGNPIVTHNVSFFNISHTQPGELRVANKPSLTVLPAGEQGVYTCRIPLRSGEMREISIGIYPNRFTTIPSITNPVVFSPGSSSSTLTCTSTGSPATNVTFMRDGTTVGLLMEGESKEVDGVTYQLTQMVTNRSQSTYQNVLTINQSLADLVGSTFTCSVENTLGTANDSHPLAITELSVDISVSYTPPPGFTPGPNEYRAASGPVTVTCSAIGETEGVSYQWTSNCRNCPFKTRTSKMFERAAVHSGDTGTHTCTAVKGGMVGSASITFVVKGAGIHVFNGVPKGSFPNNSLVSVNATDTQFHFRLFCRSDSMREDVGMFIGLNGNTIDSHNNSFFDISHPNPGELRVVNKSNLTDLPAGEQGVYTCRIPLQSGEMKEIYIGIYPSGFITLPSITDPLVFSPGSSYSTLTCISTGSVATNVTFMRNGTTVGPLRGGESKEFDGVTYQLTQMVTNRSQSTYQNVLTINQPLADIVGSTFTCSVENTLGTANDSHPLAITGLYVNISVSYTPPPGFIPGPNEYRAASGPVTVTCTAIGETEGVSYQWSSTCRKCLFKTKNTGMIERAAVHSGDNGTHTCKAVKGDLEGSASITFFVKGAGIHVFNGVPKGSFPNNSLVSVDATNTMFRLQLFCRSDSMREDVRMLIGLDGNPIVTHSDSFLNISHPQPGELRVANNSSLTDLPPREQGVYTCRIPLQSAEMKEISIGIYPSGFTTIPSITDPLVFTPGSSSSTLTCTSTGSPATNVTFMRDGTTVGPLMEGESKEVDGVTYQLTQMVTNRSQSTYQNVLTINQSLTDIVGSTFTCSVENTLGTANDSHPLAITVTISAVGSERLGEMYNISCDVTGITGDAVNYTWSGPDITGKEHNHQQLSLSPLTLDAAGQYTCTATVNSLYLATSHTNVTIAIPEPVVEVSSNASGGDLYAGSILTLICTITIDEQLMSAGNMVMVTSTWMKDDLISSNSQRITISEHNQSTNEYINTLSFNTLRISDAGNYTCKANISHSSLFTVDGIGMANTTIMITNPTVILSLTSNTTRLPNVPPYNTFSLTCTATVPEGVMSSKTFTWKRKRTSPVSESDFQMINNNHNTTIKADVPNSQSVLTVTEAVDGVYVYQCSVRLEELAVGNSTDSTPITVTAFFLFISISTRGNAVAGESYTLTCTANMTEEVPDTLMADWSGPGVGMDDVTSGNGSRNGFSFTFDLTFHSLRQSYNGEYNCTAHLTTASSLANSSVITLTAAAPEVTVTGVANPMDGLVIAGEPFSITCMVNGAVSLEAKFNFELIAEDNGAVIHHQDDARDTQFLHNFNARASDAGQYICKVTVDSDFLARPITSMSTAVTLTVQLATPVLTVNRDPDGSVTLRHGDPLNLTCTIELDKAVDINVTVSGALSGQGIHDPRGTAQLVRSAVYQIRKTISSLTAAKSAVYTCNATVSPAQEIMNVRASEKNISTLSISVELFVNISISYNPPPGVVLGPNEYRAASGPVTVTCTAIGGTGDVSYQWSSDCRSCPFQIATQRSIFRGAVHSGDTGTHTCTATTVGITGNTSINVTVKDAGIHVFIGMPMGSFPNNGLVSHDRTTPQTYRLRFYCRSDSTEENVGELIGLNGSATHNTSFFEILNSQPGELEVRSNVSDHTPITPSEEGIYTCRIPLSNGEVKEINIGIYHSDTATINITSVVFRSESSSSTLTCISTGSPPTTVTWTVRDGQNITMRDGYSETRNGITYQLKQTVIDRKDSTYRNVLNISSTSADILEYACTVNNSLSSETKRSEVRVAISAVGSERLGEMYSLSCDVTGITGVAINYTWSGPGITGKGRDHQLLSLSPVTLVVAGQYTCTATVDSLHLTTSKNVTIAIPAPEVQLSNASGGDLYAGSILTLSCTITIDDQLMTAGNMVMVTASWMNNSVIVTSNGQRITTSQTKRTGSTNEYISTLSFNTLRIGDTGRYTCQANIGHSSLFTVDGIGMASTTIMVTNPTVMLSLTSNTTRLPNVPPHNTVSLTCTATVPEGVVSPKTFTWQRRRTGPGSGSDFQIVSNSESTVIEPDIPNSQSVLTVTEEVDGVYVYQCSVRLAELAITDSTDSTPITVTAFSLFTNISARGNVIAGENYTLTCTITVTEGVQDTLMADWSGRGLLVGMDEVTSDRVSAQTNGSGSLFTIDLTFHSLRQSYNGEYSCTAHLTTVSLTDTSVTTLTVKAPNVTVTVTVNPVNGLVIAGKMVSINCMNTGADSLEATFDFELIAEDNRTVMHYQEDTRDAQVVYTSKARASDAGKYVCKVTVDSDFLDAPITSMSTAVTLTVQPPVVEVIGSAHPIGVITAGNTFSITCIVNGTDSLVARFNYKVIDKDNGSIIYHQEDASNTQFTHSFTARASDAGKYVCNVTVDSDFLDEAITISSTAVTLTVQIATPVLTVSRDPDASVTLRHGDPLNLTCIIELDPAVDINVIVSGTLSGPGSQDPEDKVEYIQSRELYQIKKSITSLEAVRSSIYTCTATVRPGQGVVNVQESEGNHTMLNVTVELFVTISVFYNPPPGVVLGPNEYRAASGPVTVTCTAIGGTGDVSYQWSSDCKSCPFLTANSMFIKRGAVHSGDNGTHTCNATTTEAVGSASIKFTVKGAGIHVFNGIPSGSFSNNNLVTLDSMNTVFRLRLFCRSDSMMRNVGELIGVDESPIVNSSFFEISNPQPGELSVVNFVSNSTNLPAGEQGVYTCRIPLQSGEMKEINIGIYPSGYNNTPTITSVIYRPENAFSKLTCNSINSPPTNVSLALADSVIVTLRDGESVTVAGVMYELMQTLTDRRTSAYTSLLSMTTTLEGNITRYRCIIINALGNDSKPAGEGSFSIRIFPSGNASAGEEFTLTCTITVTEVLVDTLTAHWSGYGVHMEGVIATNLSIQTSGNFSTFTLDLTFTPLRQAHDGDYVCTANLATFTDSYSTEVLTIVPLVEVHISGGGVVEFGESLVLDCVISGVNNLEGNIAFQWRGPNRAREESTSTRLTLSTVDFSDAGIYTCTATVSSPYLNEDISANDTVSVIISVPSPDVAIEHSSRSTIIAGTILVLSCTITLDERVAQDTQLMVTSRWTGPHGELDNKEPGNETRVTVMEEQGTSGQYSSIVTFNTVHVGDSGSYSCEANVSHQVPQFIHQGMNTSVTTVNVQAPNVSLSLTPNTTRLPNVAPYNTFSLTCTATAPEGVVSPKTFSWSRKISKLNVSLEEIEISETIHARNTPLDKPESSSTLVVTETTAGIWHYSCEVSIAEINVSNKTNAYPINVTGPMSPEMPTHVTVRTITIDSATVYWTVPTIAFTPETYVVHYGTNKDTLDSMSDPVTGMNFTTENNEFSITLPDLAPNTLYFYQVNSSNKNGSSFSQVANFTTEGQASDSFLVPVVVGGISAAVVIAVLCIVGIAVFRMRKQSKGKVQLKRGPSAIDAMVNVELTAIEDTEIDHHNPVPVSNLGDVTCRKSIPIVQLSDHVSNLHGERDKGFEAEYDSISKAPLASYDVSVIPCNQKRNRFANIYPYDFSRVKLKEIEGVEGSDYINASFLDGYTRESEYIASQGPVPESVGDFWRMIWEYKLTTIVMLTKCDEGRKHKCEQYWPNDVSQTKEPGHNLVVTLTGLLPFADYEIRNLSVKDSTHPDEPALEVTHLHYLSWPDHGVPTNSASLINFIRRVRKVHPHTTEVPLLVHCSAGVGRTGTFIVMDIEMQRIDAEEIVDIHGCTKKLRASRVLMVQTLSQYIFIHEALNELVTCGRTDMTAASLRITTNRLQQTIKDKDITGFQEQFQFLDKFSPDANNDQSSEANYLQKNRYTSKVAGSHNRVYLKCTGPGAEYINANFVDGYRQRGAYIATQGPLAFTVKDFWRMIWQQQSKCIVMLCSEKEEGKESCYPYWPDEPGNIESQDEIQVTLLSEEKSGSCIIRKLEVFGGKTMGYSDPQSVTVTQFQLTCWPPHSQPSPPSCLLDVMDNVARVQMATGNRPITVMCNDGVGRTGAFICLHAQLERLKAEGVVDIFQFIKSARRSRPGLVQNVEQYILCHKVLRDFVDSFETYANFKELV